MQHNHAQNAPGPPPRARLRSLLAKLRDLDLRAAHITVNTGLEVVLEGCASPDASAGRPLHYRLRSQGGDARLEVRMVDGDLELLRQDGAGVVLSQRRVPFEGGPDGLLVAPNIRARINPDVADARETERFLRRIVRAAFA